MNKPQQYMHALSIH